MVPRGGTQSLNPKTAEESLLFPTTKNVYLSHPEYSTDGKRIACFYNPSPNLRANDSNDSSGIWVFSLKSGDGKFVTRINGIPIGWSNDDSKIYYLMNKNVCSIDTLGQIVDTIFTLPFDNLLGRATITRDGKTLACLDWNFITDIWLIENFDPATNE